MYNYYYNVKEDVKEALFYHNYDYSKDLDELKEEIYNDMLEDDEVIGYGCGTYTHNRHSAERNLEGNEALLSDAMEWLEYSNIRNPEWEDVMIRKYLLRDVIDDVLYEMTEA